MITIMHNKLNTWKRNIDVSLPCVTLLQQPVPNPSAASLGSTHHSQLDKLHVRYKPVNFGLKTKPGPTKTARPNIRADLGNRRAGQCARDLLPVSIHHEYDSCTGHWSR